MKNEIEMASVVCVIDDTYLIPRSCNLWYLYVIRADVNVGKMYTPLNMHQMAGVATAFCYSVQLLLRACRRSKLRVFGRC